MLAELAEAIKESNRENNLEIIRSINDVGEVLYEEQQRTTDEISRQTQIEGALSDNVIQISENPSVSEENDIESGVDNNPVVAAINTVNQSILSLREIFIGMAEAAAREDLQDQENENEESDDEPTSKPSPFRDAFNEGRKDPFNLKKRFRSIKASIRNKVMGLLTIAGRMTGVFTGMFKLVTGIFGRIFAVVTGIVMGVDQAIKDFTNMEGDLFDKLTAGIFGFIEGFSKIITVPLDYLKKAIAWIAGKLGFEQFEEMLNSFSIAEEFEKLMEKMLGFILGIKDSVLSTGGNILSKGLRLIGQDETADKVDAFVSERTSTSAEDRVSAMKERDDGKLGSGIMGVIEKTGTNRQVSAEIAMQTPLGDGPPMVVNNYTSAPTSVNTQNNIDQSGPQSVASPVSGNSSQSDAWAM